MKRNTLVAAIAAAGLGLATGHAYSATVESQFFYGDKNQLSDNSAENLVDRDANDRLDEGDSLRGIAYWNTVENLDGGGVNPVSTDGVNELTSIFQAKVYDATFVLDQDPGGIIDPTGDDRDDFYNYVFGPDPAFAAEWEATLGLDAGTLAGAIVLFFEDPTPDYDRTIAGAEATATNGSLVWAWGFGADDGTANANGTGAIGDEIWTGLGPYDPSILRTVAAGAGVGSFNFQMSVLYNGFANTTFGLVDATRNTGLGDRQIQINAQGGILGTKDVAGIYDVWDNVDAVFRPQRIPEPASIALIGLGLAGLGMVRRRRPLAVS